MELLEDEEERLAFLFDSGAQLKEEEGEDMSSKTTLLIPIPDLPLDPSAT